MDKGADEVSLASRSGKDMIDIRGTQRTEETSQPASERAKEKQRREM
jgi:hypothetical protein